MAKDVFEEAEIAAICSEFRRVSAEAAGELPSPRTSTAFELGKKHVEPLKSTAMQQFYLTSDWSDRLEQRLYMEMQEFQRLNGEKVLDKWQHFASDLAEGADCFFLGKLSTQLLNYSDTYGAAFSGHVYDIAIDIGTDLQRARLRECVKLKSLLWPCVPWLIWPVCSMYLRQHLSGLISLALHLVLLAGAYFFLNQLG